MKYESWRVFSGDEVTPKSVPLPAPPRWRDFSCRHDTVIEHSAPAETDVGSGYWDRALSYRVPSKALDAINAALLLRRPLLITGRPGTGKSSLIYRVAFALNLGRVLVWPVNSRSTLREGLYDYDAISRLQDSQLEDVKDIGRYITLRALGTALLPSHRPRAILIDELDKADPDLPNDLLNVFEEGWFEIPELARHDVTEVRVRTSDYDPQNVVAISRGRVQCHEFPFVVLTSNGEREFAPAFLRRCIRVDFADPTPEELREIVRAHLGSELADEMHDRIERFAKTSGSRSATDQLLNALHIIHSINGSTRNDSDAQKIYELLTRPLTEA